MYKQTTSLNDVIRALQARAHQAGTPLVDWCAVQQVVLRGIKRQMFFDPRHVMGQEASAIVALARGQETSFTIEELARKFPLYRPDLPLPASAVAA
jgi:hypothetical protein